MITLQVASSPLQTQKLSKLKSSETKPRCFRRCFGRAVLLLGLSLLAPHCLAPNVAVVALSLRRLLRPGDNSYYYRTIDPAFTVGGGGGKQGRRYGLNRRKNKEVHRVNRRQKSCNLRDRVCSCVCSYFLCGFIRIHVEGQDNGLPLLPVFRLLYDGLVQWLCGEWCEENSCSRLFHRFVFICCPSLFDADRVLAWRMIDENMNACPYAWWPLICGRYSGCLTVGFVATGSEILCWPCTMYQRFRLDEARAFGLMRYPIAADDLGADVGSLLLEALREQVAPAAAVHSAAVQNLPVVPGDNDAPAAVQAVHAVPVHPVGPEDTSYLFATVARRTDDQADWWLPVASPVASPVAEPV